MLGMGNEIGGSLEAQSGPGTMTGLKNLIEKSNPDRGSRMYKAGGDQRQLLETVKGPDDPKAQEALIRTRERRSQTWQVFGAREVSGLSSKAEQNCQQNFGSMHVNPSLLLPAECKMDSWPVLDTADQKCNPDRLQ